MAIIFYSKTCEDCSGNHALASMKSYCKKRGVVFEEHRTILWSRYEEEANKIMALNEGLKLPFFYGTESGQVLSGFSMTPIDELSKLVKSELGKE